MTSLRLFLLGPPRLERGGAPIEFDTRKNVALIAYLAVTGEFHTRETLITLLWPELEPSRARAGLRRNLSTLRKALGGEWLTVDREMVGLTPSADPSTGSEEALWLDVEQFRGLLQAWQDHHHSEADVCPDCLDALAEAVELYRGDFLEGFTLRDSPNFDEWQFFQTEGLRQELASALERLVRGHAAQAAYESAIRYARRWLALDSLHEPTHRHLMQLYAWSGRRSAALRQYRECVRILEEELGVLPSAETTALYERIRVKRVRPTEREPVTPTPTLPHPVSPHLPAFLRPVQDAVLTEESEPVAVERSVFVARERQLARLDGYLQAMLAGQGQVVFITGGPGRGKTTLMREFARRAMEAHSGLLVAGGNCNAYSGVGDPYLPFREVMGMLTGDAEARWAAGVVARDHAQRLWAGFPLAAQALVDYGPSLIDTILPGAMLLSRAEATAHDGTDWPERLRTLAGQEKPTYSEIEQSGLFEQFTNVLYTLAEVQPLLLMLDDVQWADTASISLLFHLGRRLGGSRILIVCAYRPEEVALGRDGERHPLESILSEFKRNLGDVWVNLTKADETEGHRFVDDLLDTEPNQLGEGFRQGLFHHTRGHPLFTVELLRAMQARGDLIQDKQGRWVVTPSLDWQKLPARVEAVIEARIGRLADDLRDVLAVASVEGERFTAQVVARVQGIPERDVLQALSRELENRHHLVRQEGEVQVGHRFLSHYRFAHALFQQYLYDGLSTGERRLLHGEIGAVLEELYRDQIQEIAVQLAHHYAEAGDQEKAIEHSLRAGDQARLAYAHQEAIDHYRRALAFLKEKEEHERAARTLMKLGLTYHTAFDFQSARQAYSEGFALWQRAEKAQPTTLPSPAPHALRMTRGGILTLDPTMAEENFSAEVIHQLFSGLVEKSPKMEAVPDVARSWEISQGGQRYVFYLRDDARWSDGIPVTAGDFAYAWRRVLDPATGSPNALLLYDIKGARPFHQGEVSDPDSVRVQALDDRTLVVELEGPAGYFLHLLTHSATYPLPRHVVEARGETWAEMGPDSTESDIITNGPFRLETWNRRESMVLARNPEYHGRFTGNLERVELSFLPLAERSASLGMYEADNLDILRFEDLPPAKKDRARQRYPGEYVSVPEPNTYYVGFDTSRPPFDDPRVRRAFVLATDRETLTDVVLRGYGFPATGGLIPPGVPGHSAGIGLAYDPEQARQLLAEAGYPGGRGFPVVDFVTWRGIKSPSEYLQAQWRESLGVETTLEIEGVVTQVIQGREPAHIFTSGWIPDYPDPDACLRASPVRRITRWRNDTYDRLVEKARRVLDQGERMRLYKQADKILIEEAAIMPIIYTWSHFLVKPWVTKFPATWSDMWLWKDIIIEPH